jgi:deoxyribodipyrimidine photo-lyase
VSDFPALRLRPVNAAPVRADGRYVLYRMLAARRVRFNFALERAVDLASSMGKPLVVLEELPSGTRFASARTHRFVLQGMEDNARALARSRVLYHPYVEETPGTGSGLFDALASRASAVVVDELPAFFAPGDEAEAAARLPVRVEAVDSSGLLPLRAADRPFPTAYAFRRFLQKTLPRHLDAFPDPDPLRGRSLPPAPTIPPGIADRWPKAPPARLRGDVSGLPVDHAVPPAPLRGGADEASRILAEFVRERLARYADDRNHPDREATSGLSPYLHFGHISTHEVLAALALHEGWSPRDVSSRTTGGRSGWWGMGASAEAFLDQLVTWRELSLNMAALGREIDRFESLPGWAQRTLAVHAVDPRPHRYDFEALEAARTHDRLWNAAQTQLLREGRIHNYLRMLWGKKILEWSASPEEALEAAVRLNDRHALDGSDANSYSGILWVFGRYDRPWGPERPIFGTVRYMTSANTARKIDLRSYLQRYGSGG